MRFSRPRQAEFAEISGHLRIFVGRRLIEMGGVAILVLFLCAVLSLITWSVQDPSLNQVNNHPVTNLLGAPGAIFSDVMIQLFGLGSMIWLAPLGALGLRMMATKPVSHPAWRIVAWLLGGIAVSGLIGALPVIGVWPLPVGLGGVIGDLVQVGIHAIPAVKGVPVTIIAQCALGAIAFFGLLLATGMEMTFGRTRRNAKAFDDYEFGHDPETDMVRPRTSRFSGVGIGAVMHMILALRGRIKRWYLARVTPDDPFAPRGGAASGRVEPGFSGEARTRDEEPVEPVRSVAPKPRKASGKTAKTTPEPSGELDLYTLPPLNFLAEGKKTAGPVMSSDALEENARLLESVLEDFGVRGEITNVRPGPVVTLYELEPAPGIKSSRVIGLADDIARSMSAISARVAVVPGRNAIGIELPNQRRETVYLRELIAETGFKETQLKLALALGKTIGGEPMIVDLARMPHLLVAGTTGSGKSVAINTMILSLLYRLKPEQCRLIMVDPKMLELSVYDGIPHLLTPVVTDPKKAVVALKWAVREMEERYKKMAKLGVRNIDGFNARVTEAKAAGEAITRTVQTGFDRDTGEAIFETEVMELEPIPYIVVIVDEMADLMMVAGKDIEGAIQRLAQMARAAGIHVILATQRPSVDVITGTIKANFPTRISFQVTSKIDSRTILGEQGAEQLLGQGDMLFMAGGGRISRVHGPFVSDGEVEKVVAHLKAQGRPAYLDEVLVDTSQEADEGAVFDKGGFGSSGQDPYDQAVAIVLRDRKASTSYIQRRLQIGYNRAATIMERMEDEGIVGPSNHAGKREILIDAKPEAGMAHDFD
jgi:DNA segregation ATPase FtsK/SpoIIIE, S-DNA-T family